jgi:hypothetical protein
VSSRKSLVARIEGSFGIHRTKENIHEAKAAVNLEQPGSRTSFRLSNKLKSQKGILICFQLFQQQLGTRITEGHVPDAVFERARAHLNQQDLIALVFTLTTINAWDRLAITMRTEVGTYQPKGRP